MRIIVDHGKCCSSGMCVASAPDVFAQRDSDGLVRLLQEHPPADLHAEVRRAADACPVGAIQVVD